MSNQFGGIPKVSIGAGTAFKIGFFGALGAMVFWIILSLIGVIVGVALGVSMGGLRTLLNG